MYFQPWSGTNLAVENIQNLTKGHKFSNVYFYHSLEHIPFSAKFTLLSMALNKTSTIICYLVCLKDSNLHIFDSFMWYQRVFKQLRWRSKHPCLSHCPHIEGWMLTCVNYKWTKKAARTVLRSAKWYRPNVWPFITRASNSPFFISKSITDRDLQESRVFYHVALIIVETATLPFLYTCEKLKKWI